MIDRLKSTVYGNGIAFQVMVESTHSLFVTIYR